MFDLEKAIADWRAEMSQAGLRPEVMDELESHLREQMKQVRPEPGDDAAFQAAVRQLGASQQLKREFSKVNRSWFPRNNPVGLNILGLVFMLRGVDALLSYTRLTFLAWHDHDFHPMRIYLGMLSVFGLQLVIGLGLMHRRNLWRYTALIIGAPVALFSLVGLAFRESLPTEDWFLMMGIAVPTRFDWITDLLSLGIMLWAFVYLTRAKTRNLFQLRAKTKTA